MKRFFSHITLLALTALLVSCSTQKNTAGSRFYHAATARFNTYYNGSVAFEEGLTAQEQGHADNYSELLPMYLPANKNTRSLGKSNFETAITKSEKAIKRHSIKKRPKSNVNKRRTDKEKAYLARKEFNPFLKNAWLMLGKAQFQRGEFFEAASTFNYITRIYATQPEVAQQARAYLARCYVLLEWPYDAEDVLNKMGRDSLTAKASAERDASYAGFLILTRQYDKAIPYLQTAIKHEKRKYQRARLYYLLGQLHQQNNDGAQAYKALKKVIRSNPPYELAFNARVLQTEVMSGGQHRQMIKRLQRMTRNPKNKDYLDQVYYAIGNIYLSQADTLHCIWSYEKGVKESTRNGVAKANVLLHLGQLYWEQEKYIDAQRCYAELVGLMDKEHDQYAQTEQRSAILTELAPHLSAVALQDSLQTLARLPEAERNAAIDRVIEALKQKEKEEEKKALANGETPSTGGNVPTQPSGNKQPTPRPNQPGSQQQGKWYFYNPMVVTRGKTEFQRLWGQRPNEDNWRISNKETSNNGEFEEYDYNDNAATDSTSTANRDNEQDAGTAVNDSLANDPHHREFYLRQIPFEPEQLAASHQQLSDGLYNAGILEMERVENFPLAYRTLLRLITDYPDYQSMDDVFYHMFLLNGRLGRPEEAENFRQQLIEKYPDNKMAVKLANPNYTLYARHGKAIEDSLYAATYAAYQHNNYNEVEDNFETSTTDFPEGAHRAKFLFIHAMTQLYQGNQRQFLQELKELISRYPQSEITEMAQHIVKGMQDGRLLSNEKYDATNIWERRNRPFAESDSAAVAQRLNPERFCNFVFMLAYPEHSLDENQLLYEMAQYNFTSFMVRNFDIETVHDNGLGELLVKGFLSFDEVHAYTQRLFSDPHMAKVLKGIRVVLISEDNLKLLGTTYSFADYEAFYEKHLAPVKVPEDLLIDEPDEIEVKPEEETPEDEDTPEDDFEELFFP